MSSLLRAWYTLLALGFLTFILTAFIGQIPYPVTSSIALPAQLLHQAGSNLRSITISLLERRDVRLENLLLQEQTAWLLQEKRQLEIQLEELEQLLRVRTDQSPGALMTAPVIGISPGAVLRQITIGRGSQHGVRANMPVTTPEGLVGIVTDVMPLTANVRAITDPQSRVGITVRGRGGQGVAVGLPGGRLQVVNFLETGSVEVGDVVETSSRGGLFPRGITVGIVAEAPVRDPNDLRIEFLVQPVVIISTVQSVVLIEAQ